MIRREEEPEDMETMHPTTRGVADSGPDDCLETAAHLHAHAEGELDPIRLRRVDEHLARCEACQEALRELHEERLWCMEMLVESPPLSPRFAEKVTGRIRARVRFDAIRRRRMWIARGVAAAVVVAASAALLAPRQVSNPGSSLGVSRSAQPELTLLSGDEARPPQVGFSSDSGRFSHASVGGGAAAPSREHEGLVHERRFPSRHHIADNVTDLWEIIVQVSPTRWGVPRDPCAPDPNRDGRTDYKDVSYTCTVIMGAPAVAFGGEAEREGAPEDDERSPGEPDCDELCLRA